MKLKERQRDSRFLKTMGFLVAKNLLKTNREDIQPRARVKLAIKDVLWAGNNVEPRILEVLPAALIHFPKTFKGLDQLPKELSSIVEQIRRQQTDGPDYKGLKNCNFM